MEESAPKEKYGSEFYKIVPTAIFGIAGVFFLAVPYEIKLAWGLHFGETSETLLAYGVAFLAVAGIFWWLNHRKKPMLT